MKNHSCKRYFLQLLRGKARQDFETRDIRTFEELKQQLKMYYLTKQSTTHLQIEFTETEANRNRICFWTTSGLASDEIVRLND